ncbi:hypothetical protein [Bosea sp. PAMC 26642]|uniref:hypothetical protein n=1 Tax=Bosea sp. (strain PAMC 26642) TaxID=1792307 RepID=UPI00077068B5|nr:hypothetical protein [Bosea sp. PAMC 26642]AMJ62695.1 hypothetical protein AXW83_22485 [Bosea sp. PAMC 26642]
MALINGSAQRLRIGREEAAFALVPAIVLFALAIRLPVGLDLSDEAYYATFIDDWLKGGIASSTLDTLHQTAALLVYPAAIMFSWFKGSSEGLFLFLRVVFLIGALASGTLWIVFLRRLGWSWQAWLSGACLIAYIPFGLPAPSYNTLGLQGLIIGLAGYGCGSLASIASAQRGWFALSVAAWGAATIAYPPLIVPLFALCLADFLISKERTWRGAFPVSAALTAAAGWSATIFLLSAQRLWDGIVYLSLITSSDQFGRKIWFTIDLLRLNPAFASLCVLAALLGLVRNRLDPRLVATAITAILLSSLILTPALYVRSHDVVVLMALCGLGLLAKLRKASDASDRLVAVIYAISLLAGIVTAATAYNSIYNFCIGGLPAASLALLARGQSQTRHWRWFQTFALAAFLAAILSTSLLVHYGELPGASRQRIHQGFFAGIHARPDDIALLEQVRQSMRALAKPPASIVVVSRLPGIVLETGARVKMRTPFPLVLNVSDSGLAATYRFYDEPLNRPEAIVIYEDRYYRPITPISPGLIASYTKTTQVEAGLGQLSLLVRPRNIAP